MAYETTTELRNLLQEEVNDTAPAATTQSRYLNLLDLAHKAVISGGRELNLDDSGHPIRRPFIFPFALAVQPKVLILEAPVSDTASVTKNSASVTITTNSATKNLTGWHFKVPGQSVTYYITLHSGVTLTLDSVYVDETAAAAGVDIFKLIYTLGSDIMIPVDKLRDSSQSFDEDSGISFVDRGELFDQYPVHRVSVGEPQLAGVLRHLNGTMTIQLSHYPSDLRRFDLAYIPIPTALDLVSSNPILPAWHRTLLVHLAAFYHLRKRDDDRANSHLATAKQLFDALTTEAQQIISGNDEKYGYLSPWGGSRLGDNYKTFVSLEI